MFAAPGLRNLRPNGLRIRAMSCREKRSVSRRLRIERLENRFCPSGGHLLVANWGGDSVLRYEESTGAFVNSFVPKHAGGMNQPYGVVVGPHDHKL